MPVLRLRMEEVMRAASASLAFSVAGSLGLVCTILFYTDEDRTVNTV